jgi:AraC family transcriptional regulator
MSQPLPFHASPLLSVERVDVPPRARLRRHRHHAPHICCVVGGGFVQELRGGSESVEAGSIRFSAAARHEIEFGPAGAACVVLELDAATTAELGALPPRAEFLRDEWLAGLVRRIDGMLRSTGGAVALSLDGAVIELLAQIARRRKRRTAPPPEWLRIAREIANDDPAASLAAVAEQVGVHRVQVARAFRDHFGLPIGAYVRRRRLERAVQLLHQALPLAQVAARAGYADQSHLTRDMTAALGAPPGTLRRSATRVQDALQTRREILHTNN